MTLTRRTARERYISDMIHTCRAFNGPLFATAGAPSHTGFLFSVLQAVCDAGSAS